MLTVRDFDTFAAHFPRPSVAGFHALHPVDDWTDSDTPRTERPVRFAFGGFAHITTGAYRPSITYRR